MACWIPESIQNVLRDAQPTVEVDEVGRVRVLPPEPKGWPVDSSLRNQSRQENLVPMVTVNLTEGRQEIGRRTSLASLRPHKECAIHGPLLGKQA